LGMPSRNPNLTRTLFILVVKLNSSIIIIIHKHGTFQDDNLDSFEVTALNGLKGEPLNSIGT